MVERQKLIEATLQKHPASDKLVSAMTLAATAKSLHAVLANGQEIELGTDGLRLAAPDVYKRQAVAKSRLASGLHTG